MFRNYHVDHKLIPTMSCSSSIWDFHFHSYVLMIYVSLYWILELIVFYSLVRRGYIRKVSVQLLPKYFSRDCSTDSISCSERKYRKKTRLKQDSKLRKEDQNVVVVANPPGSSSLRCRNDMAPLLHHYCYAVALLSLCCCIAIAPLLFCCHSTAVAPLSHHFRMAVALLLLRSRSVVVPLLHHYHTAIVPLSLRRCCSAVAPLSHRYRTDFALLLLRCRCSLFLHSQSLPQEA